MSMWWLPRARSEATADYLARVLAAVPLQAMAAKARARHYDDFFCPPEVDDGMNMMRLAADLKQAADHARDPQRKRRILEVRKAVVEGEFDGTREESDAWAASPEGQETMRHMLGGR